MPEKKAKLTKNEIKEAIKKKHCPYCKSRKFVGFLPAWQRFDLDKCDSEGKPFYYNHDTSAEFKKIKCNKCWKEIPEIIWRNWEL